MDRERPKSQNVGVIVVNWNGGELLGECLKALLCQTMPPKRIVVVDNNSTDGSVNFLEDHFPNIDLIQLAENIGFAAANNLAIKEMADCEWCALVNPDAIVADTWLERLTEMTVRHPEYACFGSRMLAYEQQGVLDGAGDIYHVSGLAWRRGHGVQAQGRYIGAEEVFSPCAAAALYRRDALLAVGGFDESFFTYYEDVDLGFRMRLMGLRCLYVPDAVVRHVGSATTGGRHSDFAVYHGHRNLVWTYFKNMPWLLFWLYLPQHLLLNLAALVWFSLHGQGRVIFKAKRDALKGLRGVLRLRREAQGKRRIGTWSLRGAMVRGVLAPYRRKDGQKKLSIS